MIATEYALARGTGDMRRATERAERALLGAVMIDGRVPTSIQTPTVGDFCLNEHQTIWKAILSIAARGAAPDLVLVYDELAVTGMTERAGGDVYLASLVDGVPCVDSVPEYARIVKERARMRRFEATGA
jgi:replicative DNA helicase